MSGATCPLKEEALTLLLLLLALLLQVWRWAC